MFSVVQLHIRMRGRVVGMLLVFLSSITGNGGGKLSLWYIS